MAKMAAKTDRAEKVLSVLGIAVDQITATVNDLQAKMHIMAKTMRDDHDRRLLDDGHCM